MSEKNAVRWENEKEKGKYLWITQTAFIWSIQFFYLTNLLGWFLEFETNMLSLFGLSFCILSGFVFGTFGWLISEREYQRYLSKSEEINKLNS